MKSAILLIAACAVLAGCASGGRVQMQKVHIPVPVQCQEPIPQEPVWPTRILALDATIDEFTRAAMAEIERREGYEVELRTALENCRKPINPRRPDGGISAQ